MSRNAGSRLRIGLLVACVAVVAGCSALWWRSASVDDRVSAAIANRRIYIGSAAQRLYLRGTLSGESRLRIDSPPPRQPVGTVGWAQLWPAYQKELLARTVFIPWWMIMTPAAVVGIFLARPLIRQAKRRAARARRSRKASQSPVGGGISTRIARRPSVSRSRRVA